MNKTKEQAVFAISTHFSIEVPPDVVCFSAPKISEKKQKRLLKALEASKLYDVEGNVLVNSHGTRFPGVAWWDSGLAFQENGKTFRYHILVVCHLGRMHGYAIRVSALEKLKSLPDLELAEKEIRLLLAVADEVTDKVEEVNVTLLRPIGKRVQTSVEITNTDFDEKMLLKCLSNSLARDLFLAGVAGNMNCLLKKGRRNSFPVNIVIIKKGGEEVELLAKRILRAVDFTEPEESFGLSVLKVSDKNDLASWWRRGERITLLRYQNEKAIRPIWREMEAAILEERNTRFDTVPILCGKSSIPAELALEILVSDADFVLTTGELEMLRAAAAKVLKSDKLLTEMKRRWKWLLSSGAQYMMTRSEAAWQILEQSVGTVLFTDLELYNQFMTVCGLGDAERQKANCVLIYSPADLAVAKRIVGHGKKKVRTRAIKRLEALDKLVRSKECLWREIEKYFGQKPQKRCKKCCNCE